MGACQLGPQTHVLNGWDFLIMKTAVLRICNQLSLDDRLLCRYQLAQFN